MRFILIFFLLTSIIYSGEIYVRMGSSGNGTNWTDAYGDLPSEISRGDTVWIADGFYNSYDFNDSESGDTYIYVFKATTTEHGTDIGWDNSYGNGQAQFDRPVRVRTDYWYIDGKVGSDTGSVQYGFKVNPPSNCNETPLQHNIFLSGYRSNITLKHIEMENCDETYDLSGHGNLYSANGANNITVSHCFFHIGNALIVSRHWSNCVIEYSYFKDNWSTSNNHGEAVSCDYDTNVTYRYNTFELIEGTGIIAYGHGPGNGHVSTDIKIYGNLVFNSETSNGSFCATTNQYLNNSLIYNNTIVNGTGHNAGVSDGSGSGGYVYNNIWYNCSRVSINGTHDYNCADINLNETHGQIIDNSIFTDYSSNIFTLSRNTNAGIELDSPFNRDMNGLIRGVDGIWDRGAFEYNSGQGYHLPTIPRIMGIMKIE